MQAQLHTAQLETTRAQTAAQTATAAAAASVEAATAVAALPAAAQDNSADAPDQPMRTEQEIMEDAFQVQYKGVFRSMIPLPTIPKGDDLAKAAKAHALLTAWMDGGQEIMFSYAALGANTGLGTEVMGFCQVMISPALFHHWQVEGQFPSDHQTVPKQLAFLLWSSLEKIDDHLEMEGAARTEAVQAYTELCEHGKRRRRGC